MTLAEMAGQFDSKTVIRAFALGPTMCSADPNGHGSLAEAAAVTPGGTCSPIPSFEGLAAVLLETVMGDSTPLPPPPPPPPPGPTGPYADEVRSDLPSAFWRLGELSATAILEDQARANGAYSGGVVLGVDPAVSASDRPHASTAGTTREASRTTRASTSAPTTSPWRRGSRPPTAASVPSSPSARRQRPSRTGRSPSPTTSHHDGQIRAAYFDVDQRPPRLLDRRCDRRCMASRGRLVRPRRGHHGLRRRRCELHRVRDRAGRQQHRHDRDRQGADTTTSRVTWTK